ncbi:MAG: hypothetical protein GEV00_22630 [Actinophytocola sp.]|nr:hypothetical protein [Actinophytocola sp.]
MQDHDDEQWRGGWDIYGVRVDDSRAVSIRIGVIEHHGDEWVAIGVAGEPPIVLSTHTASDAAELFQWALDERDLVHDQRLRRETDALKHSLDRAILTRRQWQTIRRALDSDTEHPDAALTILREAAPSGWTENRPASDGQAD